MSTAEFQPAQSSDSYASRLETRPIKYVRVALCKHVDGRRKIIVVEASDPEMLERLVRHRVSRLPDGWGVVY